MAGQSSELRRKWRQSVEWAGAPLKKGEQRGFLAYPSCFDAVSAVSRVLIAAHAKIPPYFSAANSDAFSQRRRNRHETISRGGARGCGRVRASARYMDLFTAKGT